MYRKHGFSSYKQINKKLGLLCATIKFKCFRYNCWPQSNKKRYSLWHLSTDCKIYPGFTDSKHNTTVTGHYDINTLDIPV